MYFSDNECFQQEGKPEKDFLPKLEDHMYN